MKLSIDKFYWAFMAACAGSLALGARAIIQHDSSFYLRDNGLTASGIAVLALAVTLAVGCFIILPTLRRGSQKQAALTSRAAQLEVVASTDPLTGLYNRRYFDEAYAEYFNEFQRAKMPLAYLALDLDHFKSVNDTYGHDAGDVVLKQLAKELGKITREHDIIARVGGEEFAILAPFARPQQIRPFAERVCRMVEHMRVDIGTVVLRPTVSIGVASTIEEVGSAEGMRKLADDRLYQAKQRGRNRVVN